MCRHAFKNYKSHYVCFDCRKTFKQPTLEDIVVQNGDWHSYALLFINHQTKKGKQYLKENPEEYVRLDELYHKRVYKCPDCSKPMYDIGMDFKAPKKDHVKKWEIVRSMYKLGHAFHTCGCHGPGYIPQNLPEYLSILEHRKAEYEKRRTERDSITYGLSTNDQIDYWNSRIDDITKEIEKIKLKE